MAIEERPEESASPAAGSGEKEKLDEIIQRKYKELKDLAKRVHWRDQKSSITATALLNEAYIRLSKSFERLAGQEYSELVAVFANVMWEILIDQARSKGSLKRGSGHQRTSLTDETDVLSNVKALPREDILTLNLAREELAHVNRRAARIFDCRFSLGMTADETAALLKLSKSTVERESREARDFLAAKIRPQK
jgi:RNA polymerase sigma factor (TIGR02999 family)